MPIATLLSRHAPEVAVGIHTLLAKVLFTIREKHLVKGKALLATVAGQLLEQKLGVGAEHDVIVVLLKVDGLPVEDQLPAEDELGWSRGRRLHC